MLLRSIVSLLLLKLLLILLLLQILLLLMRMDDRPCCRVQNRITEQW